jgi:hypothetical protein
MKRYRLGSEIVEAVQITDDTFDAPHPNPERVVGVLYDAGLRQALVRMLHGQRVARLGDWIVRRPDGTLSVMRGDEFRGVPVSADVLAFESRRTPKP